MMRINLIFNEFRRFKTTSLSLISISLFILCLNAYSNETCNMGQFVNDKGGITKWACDCGKPSDGIWVNVGGSCFHKMGCDKGDFTNSSGKKVLYICGCEGENLTGWTDVKNGCFHKEAQDSIPSPDTDPIVDQGETTIESAKTIPAGSLFKVSKFAGVFDPRNMDISGFNIVNSDKNTVLGIGKCLVKKEDIGFNFIAKNQNEVMAALKLSVNEASFFKVVIPPGVSSVSLSAVSNNWGNALTTVAGAGKLPVESRGQTQGRFSLLYSSGGNNENASAPSAIVGGNPNQKETYATAWFYNKNTNGNIAVSLVTVIFQISDHNLYNQWLERTTGKVCENNSGTGTPIIPPAPAGNYTYDEILPDVFSAFKPLRAGQTSFGNVHDDPRTGTHTYPFPARWNTLLTNQSVRLKILIPPGISMVGWYLQAPNLVAHLGVCDNSRCIGEKAYPPTIFPFEYNNQAAGAIPMADLPALTSPNVGYITVNALSHVNFTFFALYVTYTVKDPALYESWRSQRNWAGGRGDCDGLGGIFCK